LGWCFFNPTFTTQCVGLQKDVTQHTGKFDFGPRKACEELVLEKQGTAVKGVSASLDFLVIGTQGSPAWKRGKYGSKIEKAVLLRRQNGKPAIVSEDHCFSYT